MASVENITAAVPAPVVEEAAEPAATAEPAASEDSVDGESEVAVASASRRPAADSLSNLLRTGLELLGQFASEAGAGQAAAGATPSRLFERIRDERSGQSYLKIRMPEPEVVDRVAHALQALLESLRR
jgi:hypothetical protein